MKELNGVGNPKICPVVAIVRKGKVLIGLRHYTPDKWRKISVWTFSGGRCDEGEKVEDTLRREVEEETGINDLNISGFLGKVKGAKEGDIVYVFLGSTEEEPKLLEPEKFSEWQWVDIKEVPDNFINPEVLKLAEEVI
ncbi:MAG: NUDIX hydrolase [bacterium]